MTIQHEYSGRELFGDLDQLPAAVWRAHDPECRRITANAAAAALPIPSECLASPSAPGSDAIVLIDGRLAGTLDLPLARAARGEAVPTCVLDIVYRDGRICTLTGQAFPCRTRDGRPAGAIAAFTDITRFRQADAALAAQLADAHIGLWNAVRLIAAVGHDLRQPIQAAGLYLELLEPWGNHQISTVIDRLRQSVIEVQKIANGLSAYANAARLAPPPTSMPIALQTLLDRWIMKELAASDRRVAVRVVRSKAMVLSDGARFPLLLGALLDQAVHCAGVEGTVLVGCRRRFSNQVLQIRSRGTSASNKSCEAMAISDNAAITQAAIFELSRRLSLPVSRRTLSGRTTLVELELPKPEARNRGPVRSGPIVVITGSAERRQTLLSVLSLWRQPTIAATDAEAAWRLLDPAIVPPRLLLVDAVLPNGTAGADVVTALIEKLATPVPAVLITPDRSDGPPRLPGADDPLTSLAAPISVYHLKHLISYVTG